MRIVLYYSHPAEPKSVVNAQLIEAVKQLGNVKVRWLDELYQNYTMTAEQISEEQKLMEKADAIFFQFPVYWYSSPPSLKIFMDTVMTYGWAFGSKGILRDKKFRVICTCGAKMQSYGGEFSASDIAKPFNHSFKFCKCDPLPPFIVFGDTNRETLVDDYLKLFK